MYGVDYNEYLIAAMNKELKNLFEKHNYKDYLRIKKIYKSVRISRTTADRYFASQSAGYDVEFENTNLLIKLEQAKGFKQLMGAVTDEYLRECTFSTAPHYPLNIIIFNYSSIDAILKDIENVYFNTTDFFSKKAYIDEVYSELRIRDMIFDLYVDIVKLEAKEYNITLNDDTNSKLKKEIDFNFSIIEQLKNKLERYDFSNRTLIYNTI